MADNEATTTPAETEGEKPKETGTDAAKEGQAEQDRAFAELRRKADDADKRAKKAEADLAKKQDTEAKEQGKYKELLEAAEKERDDAKADLLKREQEARVSEVAQRLRFRDPHLASRLLDADDMESDAACESALKSLAKKHDYLIAPPPERSGTEVGGGGGSGKTDDPAAAAGAQILDAIAGRAP